MSIVYALTAPDGEIGYIGHTTSPLWNRLSNHKSAARRHQATPVTRWVRRLLNAGQPPLIALLEEVPDGGDWAARERYWIDWFRSAGVQLANVADGGNSNRGWRAQPETRARMSASARQRSADPAERARLASISNRMPPVGRGERNGFARYTDAQIAEVRRMVASGDSQTDVARHFGMSKSHVSSIIHNRVRSL